MEFSTCSLSISQPFTFRIVIEEQFSHIILNGILTLSDYLETKAKSTKVKSSSFSGLQDAICLYSILSTDGQFECVASSTMSYSLDHSTSDETSVVHQSLKADGRKKPRSDTRWPIFRQRVMPQLCSILNSFNPHEKKKDCVRLLWASELPCLALVQ